MSLDVGWKSAPRKLLSFTSCNTLRSGLSHWLCNLHSRGRNTLYHNCPPFTLFLYHPSSPTRGKPRVQFADGGGWSCIKAFSHTVYTELCESTHAWYIKPKVFKPQSVKTQSGSGKYFQHFLIESSLHAWPQNLGRWVGGNSEPLALRHTKSLWHYIR